MNLLEEVPLVEFMYLKGGRSGACQRKHGRVMYRGWRAKSVDSFHKPKYMERERETERQADRDRESSNSKSLTLKDSSVRSIWTYLTASPCYTTNTKLISTTIPRTDIIRTNKQLINAVSQSSFKSAETSELNFFHGHTCIQQSNF